MNTRDKIQWLADNEGSEVGDGYTGLITFLGYCCDSEMEAKLLDHIQSQVDDQYEIIKEEMIYFQEDNSGTDTVVDLIWSDLCGRSGFDLGTLDEDTQREIKASWSRLIRSNI